MPNTNTSPNMNLVVPVNLTDATPDWGQRLYDALFTGIDQHDHSTGKGIKVPSAGLNINADLGFTSFNATALRSARFTDQGAPLALGSDKACLYSANGELFFNDTSGRQVQLTLTGSVKSAPQTLINLDVTTSYTILAADLYQLFFAHSETASTGFALPSSGAVAVGRVYYILDVGGNAATNPTTITPNGGDTINGVGGAVVVSLSGALVVMTNVAAGKWTMNVVPQAPLGAQATSPIALTTGTVTLTAAQLAKGVLRFSGNLAGAVTLVFPNSQGYFLCDFSQVVMGAFTIAAQSGSTTSATLAAADIGSTLTKTQVSTVLTYGGNTVRIKA